MFLIDGFEQIILPPITMLYNFYLTEIVTMREINTHVCNYTLYN